MKVKSLKYFLIILIISCNSACRDSIFDNNNAFLKEYGSEIKEINQKRERSALQERAQGSSFKTNIHNWQSPGMMMGVGGYEETRSAYIDTSKIRKKKKPEAFLPDFGTLSKSKMYQNNNFKVFDISYPKKNYPKSYKIRTVSFDNINIPKNDFYNIASDIDNKEYNIIDHNILQQNIDFIDYHRGIDDKKINLILLGEREEVRRNKIAKLILGKNN